MTALLRQFVRRLLPTPARRWLVRQTRWPRVGSVRPEDLRRVEPISRSWGGDRGQPIDRFYIERFLDLSASDIRGRVLEFGDNSYTLKFGGTAVQRSDVADVDPANPAATIIADLAAGTGLPDAAFDCIICTQTIQFIADADRAVAALRRALRPGGVLLLTAPGISQVVRDERNPWPDFWRYTPGGLEVLLARSFTAPPTVHTYGNVFTAIAFLHGLAMEELAPAELEHADAAYPLIVAARATA
jgi:SAM-dependent methyltransferase